MHEKGKVKGDREAKSNKTISIKKIPTSIFIPLPTLFPLFHYRKATPLNSTLYRPTIPYLLRGVGSMDSRGKMREQCGTRDHRIDLGSTKCSRENTGAMSMATVN